MSPDPRQIDLEEYLHYQNDPEFIGPRLPKDHPAYRARVERVQAQPGTVKIDDFGLLRRNRRVHA